MKIKVKNTIPVYDICALADTRHLNTDIIAEQFGHYLDRHPGLKFPHRHSFYHMVYFAGGSGTHSIDFQEFPVTPGQIYFMAPGQVHSWFFDSKPEGYIINFPEALMHSFLREGQYLDQFSFFSGHAADCVVMLREERDAVVQLLQQIVNEVGAGALFSMDMVRAALLTLFIRVAREAAPGTSRKVVAPNQVLLHNFRKLVEQHYNTLRLPKDYAQLLYITPNHLNALCSDLLGKPAGVIIRDRILLEAQRMLVSSGADIAEIAALLNFSDNSYFTKFFKKYAGTTPENFRSAAGEKLKDNVRTKK